MDVIQKHACARAGLLGNPSDGYFGKTISFVIRQLQACVEIQNATVIRLVPGKDDLDEFDSIDSFAETISRIGYYGGQRLIKATIKRFYDYCQGRHELHAEKFQISYHTSIPRSVGLAGSSAIIVAALRALAAYYHITIRPDVLASLAWSVEAVELGIPAGMQDRVIQSLEGLVYMDFARNRSTTVESFEIGSYEVLPTDCLGNIYVAYCRDAGEPTEVVHSDLKQRFADGDQQVVDAMHRFAGFAEAGKQALLSGDERKLARLIDDNFDLRAQICQLRPSHLKMVATARGCGASAKFCGSGGAIVGSFQNDEMFQTLQQELAQIDCQAFCPTLDVTQGESTR